MARRGTARGAPHPAGLLLLASSSIGCLYDWTVPDEASGGGASSTGAGGSGGDVSSSGGAPTGGGGGAAVGGGGFGGAGGEATGCAREIDCNDCKQCVYDELAGTGTQQQCALYLSCVLACGMDLGCQGQCMNTFPGGYAVQLELLQSCSSQCPNNPSCI